MIVVVPETLNRFNITNIENIMYAFYTYQHRGDLVFAYQTPTLHTGVYSEIRWWGAKPVYYGRAIRVWGGT